MAKLTYMTDCQDIYILSFHISGSPEVVFRLKYFISFFL